VTTSCSGAEPASRELRGESSMFSAGGKEESSRDMSHGNMFGAERINDAARRTSSRVQLNRDFGA